MASQQSSAQVMWRWPAARVGSSAAVQSAPSGITVTAVAPRPLSDSTLPTLWKCSGSPSKTGISSPS